MTFLAASWLYALPLAAAPVAFHLIMRRRRRAVVLPSLMFLHLVDPRHRARRKLRELAVLLLRCLAVAAAILALARPSVAGIGGGPAAVLILIDNSASMALPAASDPQRSVLDLANAGAGALIAALSSGDAVAVLPVVPDPAVPNASSLDRSHDPARRVLDALRPTDAAARPAAALRRVAALLGGSGAARRELHLFTDGQAGDWGLAAAGAELPAGTSVIVHRIDAKAPAAAAVLSKVDGPGRLPVGRPLVIHAALANRGGDPAPVTVQAIDDAGRTVSVPATVPPGGAADVALVLPGSDAGVRAVRVRIDGAPGPGATGCVIVAVEAPRSVIALGGRAALGALAPALDPSGDGALSGLKVASVPPEALGAALAAGNPLLACAAWDAAPDVLARLAAWAEAGGAVVLVPPPSGSGGPPAWSGCEPDGAIADKAGLALIASDPGDPLLRDLVAPDGAVDLGGAHVRRALALRPGKDAHAVLATADGRAVLVATARGKGRVATFGFPWFRTATDLPARAQALALAQGLALPVAPEPPAQALVAGEAPRLAISADAQVRLLAPGGNEAWKGRAGELPPPPRAGAWNVLPQTGQPLRLAVRADPAEGDPRACSAGTLPALAAFDPQVRTLGTASAAAESWRTARSGSDLAPWLILLLVLVLALESWLANPLGAQASACRGNEGASPS